MGKGHGILKNIAGKRQPAHSNHAKITCPGLNAREILAQHNNSEYIERLINNPKVIGITTKGAAVLFNSRESRDIFEEE